jgi:predicted acetyltransferase
MEASLELSDDRSAHIIKNLWPLYQHDVSEFDSGKPNRHGLFGAEETVRTLAEHSESMNAWWSQPKALFPYLIRVDGQPAGFNLIAARPRIHSAIPADYVVHEFFLLHAYRGGAVAEKAVTDGFDRHRGAWEVVTYPGHRRAIAFWRRVIDGYSRGVFLEKEMDHPWGRKMVFRFDNAQGEPAI